MNETTPSIPGAPAPMEGHGAYNRSSRVQAAGLEPAVSLLEQAAAEAELAPAPAPIVIADYGSSEGHNSLLPLGRAIGELRRRVDREPPISVVHTDLPGNDFSALFEMLVADPDSYLKGDPMVFPSAIGRSFYEQILPPESVTLGWSSWAVQWLSHAPAPIPGHFQAAFSQDPAAKAAFARQADEDWRCFLSHRGRELRTGGRLVVLTMALDEAEGFGYACVVKAIHGGLLGLVEQGTISEAELGRMVIPTVARSRKELEAPFGADGRFAGLRLERLEIFRGEDRIWSEFEQHRNSVAFGARWAAFSRASVFPSLALGLEGGLEDPRAGAFIARLEAAMAARLAAAPEPVTMPLARMLLVKD